jgi:polysaccharide biosynthesis/export protein
LKIPNAFRCGAIATLMLSLAALASAAPSRAEAYKVQPGDVLRFSIQGVGGSEMSAPVDSEGRIRLPIIGAFDAGGHAVDEIQAQIRNALKGSRWPVWIPEQGTTIWLTVDPASAVVDVVEYRPVFVYGDVLNPGSQPYRPGLTVRQAAALSGGYSAFRGRDDFSLELAGISQQYRSATEKLMAANLRVARLRAEVEGRRSLDLSTVPSVGTGPQFRNGVEAVEKNQFDARLADLDRETATIQQGIKSAEVRQSLLSQSQEVLEKETATYEAELKRVEALLKQGLIQADRVNDAQRSLFLVATRSLDTSAEVARLERELVELRGSLEKLVSQRRTEDLADLQETSLEAADLSAQIEKLKLQSTLIAPRIQQPIITIFGRQGGKTEGAAPTEDSVLAPGDTVLVTLPPPALDRTELGGTELGGLNEAASVEASTPASQERGAATQ